MTIVETLRPLTGAWKGVNRLRLLPTDEYRQTAATATVSVTGGRFVTVAYTWSEEDKPQDGMMLIGEDGAVWVDSWHTPDTWMQFSREPGTDGTDGGIVRLAGVYEKEWGWRIHLDPATAKITMHNVPPGHPPYQAVEISLAV